MTSAYKDRISAAKELSCVCSRELVNCFATKCAGKNARAVAAAALKLAPKYFCDGNELATDAYIIMRAQKILEKIKVVDGLLSDRKYGDLEYQATVESLFGKLMFGSTPLHLMSKQFQRTLFEHERQMYTVLKMMAEHIIKCPLDVAMIKNPILVVMSVRDLESLSPSPREESEDEPTEPIVSLQ